MQLNFGHRGRAASKTTAQCQFEPDIPCAFAAAAIMTWNGDGARGGIELSI